MPDDPEPPRKTYQLKPRTFDRANEIPPEPSPPTPTRPPAELDPSQPVDVRHLARIAAHGAPLLTRNSPGNRPNDVHALLRKNHAHASAAGLNRVSTRPRQRSRRRRDYWILMVLGNGGLLTVFSLEVILAFQVMCLASGMPEQLGALIRFGFLHSPILAMAALGMFTYSVALTWLMFGMMGDY